MRTHRRTAEAWQADGYFCNEPSKVSQCTLGRMAVGHCTLKQHPYALEPQFQYFADAPSWGGFAAEDYCPVWTSYNNYDCSWEQATPYY